MSATFRPPPCFAYPSCVPPWSVSLCRVFAFDRWGHERVSSSLRPPGQRLSRVPGVGREGHSMAGVMCLLREAVSLDMFGPLGTLRTHTHTHIMTLGTCGAVWTLAFCFISVVLRFACFGFRCFSVFFFLLVLFSFFVLKLAPTPCFFLVSGAGRAPAETRCAGRFSNFYSSAQLHKTPCMCQPAIVKFSVVNRCRRSFQPSKTDFSPPPAVGRTRKRKAEPQKARLNHKKPG